MRDLPPAIIHLLPVASRPTLPLCTTPAPMALFSLVILFTHQLLQGQPLPTRQAVWYIVHDV